MSKTKWKVVRIILEEYEAFGDTKAAAKEHLASIGNPHRVRVMRETITKVKEPGIRKTTKED